MFSGFIAQKLYEVNVIGKEEVELYQYCLNAFIEIMGFIIIVILHSIYMGEAMKGLIFLGIVIPMRSHGGGWHANTAKVDRKSTRLNSSHPSSSRMPSSA